MSDKIIVGRWAEFSHDYGYRVYGLADKFKHEDPEIRQQGGVFQVFTHDAYSDGVQVGPDFDTLEAAKVFYLLTFGGG